MSFITSLGDWLRKITQSFASASISGQNITLTRHNGDTVVLTTQDTVNNAFTKIKIGTATLEPDSTADTLTLDVGAGISLSANATNDSITIGAVAATQSVAGIMSTTDKTKLDNLPAWSLANSAGRASGSMIYNTYLAMRGIDSTTTLTLAAAEDGNANKGAKFYLYGTGTESHQGEFILQAANIGGTYKQLIGNADGTLTWNGTSIVNQNAFANVKVGSITIAADAVTDTVELAAGNNVTLTPDTTNDKVTIAATDTVTTVTTIEGTGNAVTSITANNGQLTVKKENTFSLINHTHSYLPLTGGTMTGDIISDSSYFVRHATNDEQLTLLGGSSGNALYGAKLALNGANYGTPGGQFTLQAGNSSGYKQLIGKPDGTLTWKGSDVVTVEDMPLSSNVSTNPYTFKIKLPNGLMLQAYYSNAFQTDANSRITWTYAEAFTETPFVFVQKIYASSSFNLYSWNKTRVIIRCNNMSGTTVGSGETISAMIFAIGRWK